WAPRPLSGPWAHPCPTAGPLRPGGFKDLFTDPTNHHMIFPCVLSSLTQFRQSLPGRSPILKLLQPKHA
ncbi:unnamed protein product, partial [Arabidopsis halleri]